MPTSTTAVQEIRFSTKDWKTGRTLIQGAKWDGTDYWVIQADRTPVGENLILHRYDAKFAHKGYLTVSGGGHGSSTGVIRRSATAIDHIIPAESKGIRVVRYEIGNPVTPRPLFFGAVGYCSAVSVNNAANRISVRKGGSRQTVTWYNRDSILKGEKPAPLFQFSFGTPKGAPNMPSAPVTFQGHYNYGDSDYFHWETDLVRGSRNYRSWVQKWTKGKLVGIEDTTAYQPKGEPQGLMATASGLHWVKRVGGDNPNRYVLAVRSKL